MEEKNEKLLASVSRKYSVSIVELGGGANRIVDKMWKSACLT